MNEHQSEKYYLISDLITSVKLLTRTIEDEVVAWDYDALGRRGFEDDSHILSLRKTASKLVDIILTLRRLPQDQVELLNSVLLE